MKINIKKIAIVSIIALTWGCQASKITLKEANQNMPDQYANSEIDSTNIVDINWREYFDDSLLTALIDTALNNNQELNIVLQELEISKSEVLEKSGEYLPFLKVGVGSEVEKAGRYTRDGAVEHELDIRPEKEFPEPLGNFIINATASWEVDIWKKLHNAKNAAELRYLASSEGKNFLVTQLIAEIAESYYELIAMDNLLEIIHRNYDIQKEALKKASLLKENAKVNQLAVNRFEAQLLNTENQQYDILQKIVETENHINFLVGRYPQVIPRSSSGLMKIKLDTLQAGLPAQLLLNRPDIRQAELMISANKLDVKVARADFYPSLDLKAGLGFQAFNPKFLFNPESLIFNIAGELMAPLINRRAIKAKFNMASAAQVQSVYDYEQTLLSAYLDVINQLAKLNNYNESFIVKQKEVDILEESVKISNSLFKYAKADYVEVLLTQEEVFDAQMELVEIQINQLQTKVQLYRALGGGWK